MTGRHITLFRLFGISVRVDISWLLIAVLITWTLAAGYFPMVLPDLTAVTYWWMGVAGLIGLAFSIVAHEFAHSLVARVFDMRIRRITLFVFGGVAELEGEPNSAKAEFLVAIAGPAMSLVVAVIFAMLGSVGEGLGAGAPFLTVLSYLATINVVLAVFNLIPAFPLDGGRVLRALLWRWKGDYVDATRIAAGIGEIFGFLLMGFALLNAFTGNLIGAIWFFLLGMFVRAAAIGNMEQALDRDVLGRRPIKRFMRQPVVGVPPDLPIDSLIDDYFYRYYFKSFPVVERERLVGTVDIRDVQAVSPENRAGLIVESVMRDLGREDAVALDATAADAIGLMRRSGRARVYVVDRGRLVGVVSLRDLLNFLDLRMRLDRPRPQ